jgi:hypothetical protein
VGNDLDNKSHDKQQSMNHKLVHPSQPRVWRLVITTDDTQSRQGCTCQKARHGLNHEQLIDHDTDNFAPSPDKTAAPSTGHHVELDEFKLCAWLIAKQLSAFELHSN